MAIDTTATAMERRIKRGMVSGSLSFSELVVMGQRAFVQERALASGLKVGGPNRKGSRYIPPGLAYAGGLYLGDPSAGSTIEVVAEELGPSLGWRRRARPGRRGTSTSRQLDQHSGSGTRVKEQRASVPLRHVRAGEVRREDFLYELKAGPAGGLRPPSGPAAPRPSPRHRPHRSVQPAPTPQPDRHVVLARPGATSGPHTAGPPGTTAVNEGQSSSQVSRPIQGTDAGRPGTPVLSRTEESSSRPGRGEWPPAAAVLGRHALRAASPAE